MNQTIDSNSGFCADLHLRMWTPDPKLRKYPHHPVLLNTYKILPGASFAFPLPKNHHLRSTIFFDYLAVHSSIFPRRRSTCLDTITRKGSYILTCVSCGKQRWDIDFEGGEKHVCALCEFIRRTRLKDAIRDFIVSITYSKTSNQRLYSMLGIASSIFAM